MLITSSTIFSLSITSLAFTVCSAHLSDLVKEFRFIKRDNRSEEFNFSSLSSDHNDKYDGETFQVVNDVYLMRDTDDTVYWTVFDYDELRKTDEFRKLVRQVQLQDNEVHFENNYYHYRIDLIEAKIYHSIYAPAWNLQKTCFTRARACDKTFQFELLSDNNSQKFNGNTSIDDGKSPSVQHLELNDGWRHEIFEIEFTQNELKSSETFCKPISKVIAQYPVYHSTSYHPLITGVSVNPNALDILIDIASKKNKN